MLAIVQLVGAIDSFPPLNDDAIGLYQMICFTILFSEHKACHMVLSSMFFLMISLM